MQDSVDRMVAQWAASAPDMDAGVLHVVGRLLLSAELAQRKIKDALRPLGLSYADFDVLNTLRRRGDEQGVHPNVLTAATLITSGAMTARVDRLVRAGYVQRTPDPDDRRAVLIRLTATGEKMAKRALDEVLAADDEFLAPLSAQQRSTLARELKRLLLAHDDR
jgi:DNA-binding MarR family transcriptional regulator